MSLSARKKNVTSSAKKFGLQNLVTRKPLADKSNTVHTPTPGKPLKSLQIKSASKSVGKNAVLNNWSKQNDYLLDTCSYDLDIEGKSLLHNKSGRVICNFNV